MPTSSPICKASCRSWKFIWRRPSALRRRTSTPETAWWFQARRTQSPRWPQRASAKELVLEHVAFAWNRHREEPQGVERRPSLDGLWRRGDPEDRRAPYVPLDRFACARDDDGGLARSQLALIAVRPKTQ